MKRVILLYLLRLIFMTAGVLACFFLNYHVIHALMPDHAGLSDNCVVNLFYETSSQTGYHAEPTMLNFFFTALIGSLLGLYISSSLTARLKLSR